ncbi:MAG: hypothetical protein WCK10_00830 [Candidatus Staskawiczbacteria bacterium]
MVFGETQSPKEEEKVPGQEDPTNVEGQQVPVPERPVLLPEAMAALDAKKAREAQEATEAEKPFDYESEKTAIETTAEVRFAKLSALLQEAGIDFKIIARLREEKQAKERYPTSQTAQKVFTENELKLLEKGDKVDLKRAEIDNQKAQALETLRRKKDELEKQAHDSLLKNIDEI